MKDTGRKIVARFLAGLAIGLCYVWLIVDARAASAASTSALGLCARVIVPSLFPFFVCSNLFCALGLERPMERVLSRVVEPLFGVPGSGAAALFVGLTGGYPSGAQSVGALYGGGSIDRKTAKRLLLFCNNCGPAFLFGVVGPSVFGSSLAGLLLYLVHVASSLLLGIFTRKSGHMQERTAQDAENVPSVSFSSALTASVKKSGQTALEVCMFVVVFGVVTAMVQTALRPVLPDWALVIVSGLLELSGGASALAEAAMPQGVKFAIASFFLAFGGLSVHAQTKAVLSSAGLDCLPVFFPKLLHALLAGVLSLPVYALFRAQLEVAQVFLPQAPALLLPAMELMLCAAICLAFRKMAGSNLRGDRV